MKKRRWTQFAPAVLFAGVGLLPSCSKVATPDHSADHTRPGWATPARLVGHPDANEQMEVQVHLALRNAADADAELAAISDPASPSYGHFLSDDEYNAKYAPTDADVAAVRAALEKSGLKVQDVPANRAYIAATGTTAQVESAFATKLGLYKVAGELRHAPVDTVKLPDAIASHVSTVLGLSSPSMMVSRSVKLGGVHPSDVFKKVHPDDSVPPNTCSEWFGQKSDTTDPAYPGYPALAYAGCGYHPAHLREAYGLTAAVRAGNDGTGQSIAIVDAFMSPTLVSDAQIYAANNDPDYPLASSQITTQMAPGTPQTPDPNWYGEQLLDVEAIHALAPGAKIVYVGAQSAFDKDLIAAINMIVTKKLATFVSNSYGMMEQQGNDFVAWHSIVTQAGLKGIGVYFASGDNGDESQSFFGSGQPSADFPCSLDNVTCVGGTSLALSPTGTLLWEVGWETGASWLQPGTPAPDGGAGDAGAGTPPFWAPAPPGQFVFGAGGGTSFVYEQPKWQAGVVPTDIANVPGAPARAVPDVAMNADPMTGFAVGMTDPNTNMYGEQTTGGTSLACPSFTAVMALAQQNAKRSLGFANPLLYQKRASAFRDILPGKGPQAVAIPGGIVATFEYNGLSIHPLKGWDNVTGLGVPNGAAFLKNIK